MNAPPELATPSLLPQDIGLGSHVSRRQFCACRDPCSGHGLAPSTQGISTSGRLKLKCISSSAGKGNPENQLERPHSFDTGTFTDSPFGVRRERLVDNSQLNSLNLIEPGSNWRSNLCARKSWVPPTPTSASHTEKAVEHSLLSSRRSETYNAWVSSWRFRPSVTQAQDTAPPCNLVSSSLKSHVSLPPCTSLPGPSSLQVPAIERNPVGESVLDGLGLLPPSSSVTVRNSCVLSGMNKLKSLRELLEILDETMIKSGMATEPLGGEEEDLPRPDSEFVIPGLAL